MDLIGNVIPQINGYCTKSSVDTLIRKITFYVTTEREFFLLNIHKMTTATVTDNTTKEYINCDPNGYVCCEQNDYVELRSSVPFELDINWDDGTDLEHVVSNKVGSLYYIRWYSLNSDYYNKYTGHGTGPNGEVQDGKKDEKIPDWGYKNHVFAGIKKTHIVTMTFTTGYIDYVYSNYIRFGKYPLFEVPELKQVQTGQSNCDVVNIDRFLYCPNVTVLNLRSVVTTKYDKFPDSLWQLTKLEYLYVDAFVSNNDPDTNGLRNVSKLKSLKSLTIHNCTNKYIKEFNELPKLYELKITTSPYDKDILDNFFTETQDINPSIKILSFGSCWADDIVPSANYTDALLPQLNNISDLSNVTTIFNFYHIPKGKETVIPEWMDRAFNVSTLEMAKAYGDDSKTSTTIDLGIAAFYNHTIQFGHNTTYQDGKYKGKKNPWYGRKFNGYSQLQPVNHRPSGTYQAPDGFVNGTTDGNPSSPMEMVYVLVNNYNWTFVLAPEAGNVITNPGDTYTPQLMSVSIPVETAQETEDYTDMSKKEVDGWTLVINDKNEITMSFAGTESTILTNDIVKEFESKEEAEKWCKENSLNMLPN